MADKSSEKVSTALDSGPKAEVKQSGFQEPGLKHVRTTSLFRAVNPELFVKPNWYVMGFGLFSITCCVAYIAYWNATADNRKQTYMALDEQGKLEKRSRVSRWE